MIKQSTSKERQILKRQQLTESFKASTNGDNLVNTEDSKNILTFKKLLWDSQFTPISKEKNSSLNKSEFEIVLPRQTLYLIDKIIRKRIKNGKFGLEYGDDMLKELQWRKSKIPVSDYSQRLKREQKALEMLSTPHKKNKTRPGSTKKTANSAPNKKFESKIHERHRINRSEEKHKRLEGTNAYGLLFSDWQKRKVIEDKLRSYLIESEVSEMKEIMTQTTQKVTEIKEEKGDAHSIWLASKKRLDEEKKAKRKEEKQKKLMFDEQQKKLAEESYKEWLRNSIVKQQIEDQIKAEKRAMEKEEAEKKINENLRHKLDVKIALKQWDSYADKRKEDEKAQKKSKNDLIKRLEKAERYKRKKEDEILCYPINLNKKKKKKPIINPQPRKTKLI